MLIIIDKNTKQVLSNLGTNSVYPDGNIPGLEPKENQEFILINDGSELANKITTATHDGYALIFDNNNLIDVNVTKTLEQYQNEQASILITEPVDPEKAAIMEAIIDLSARTTALENK